MKTLLILIILKIYSLELQQFIEVHTDKVFISESTKIYPINKKRRNKETKISFNTHLSRACLIKIHSSIVYISRTKYSIPWGFKQKETEKIVPHDSMASENRFVCLKHPQWGVAAFMGVNL